MSLAQLEAAIQARLPDAQVEWSVAPEEAVLSVRADAVLDAAEMLRDEPELRCDLLLAGAPFAGHMSYQLASTRHHHRVRLRTPLAPGSTPLPSLAFVWPAANWLERESRDGTQLEFSGHPEPEPLLRRTDLGPRLPLDGSRDTFLHGTRYPTSHDGLSLRLQVHGERVEAIQPLLGARRVGLGQHLTRLRYDRSAVLAARLDGFAALSCDLAYTLAIEALLGTEVPPRARLLRTLYAELARLASHLFWMARLASDATDPSFAGPAYALRGRHTLLKLFEWLGGNAIAPDLVAVGGLRRDAPHDFDEVARQAAIELRALLDDLGRLITDHSGLRARLHGLGVIDAGTAVGLGVTGPCLRASGVSYDVRQAFPYAAYPLLDLEIPTTDTGDALGRFQVRMAEMRIGIDLILQCLSRIKGGAVNAYGTDGPPAQVPQGTAYAAVEGPRGELGVLVAASGGARLDFAYIRGPSFANVSAVPFMAPGTPLSQVRLLVDSLDLSAGEAER